MGEKDFLQSFKSKFESIQTKNRNEITGENFKIEKTARSPSTISFEVSLDNRIFDNSNIDQSDDDQLIQEICS